MNADGTNLRRLTVSRVANHAYTAAQWSKDNVHVLANRQTFTDDSLTRANFALRIVNADTRALLQLPAGVRGGGRMVRAVRAQNVRVMVRVSV
jgi:hypothetical protein